jgi:hypothetical protein
LEITVSFLGIQKWEPDIYIGFVPRPSFAVQQGDGGGEGGLCDMLKYVPGADGNKLGIHKIICAIE